MFSVVLPVYNGEKWIEQTIRSIQNQTHENFECIVVCNGCTDQSLDVIKEAIKNDKRFCEYSIGIANKANALNFAVTRARGSWIAPIDADDVWQRNKLEVQKEYIRDNPSLDVVGTQIRCFAEGEHSTTIYPGDWLPVSHADIITYLQEGKNPVAFPTVAYRKDIHLEGVGFYNTTHFVLEDYEFWQRCRNLGCCFANTTEKLVDYRLHPGHEKDDSLVVARQYIAKQIVDAMFVDVSEDHIPEEWGLIGHLRGFDLTFPRDQSCTPTNSNDKSRGGAK